MVEPTFTIWRKNSDCRKSNGLVSARFAAPDGDLINARLFITAWRFFNGISSKNFLSQANLWSHFPAGALAIFAAQVAKLAHRATIFGCVGSDGFGWLNICSPPDILIQSCCISVCIFILYARHYSLSACTSSPPENPSLIYR